MKSLSVFKLLLNLIIILSFKAADAQISFTDSAYKTLNSDQELLYEETKITFNTGIYRSTDYRFEKISDSICPLWIVTACFNAECWNEILDSGQFTADYNPDSNSCFIAFHVFSLGKDGRSKIRYRVINKKDSSDQAVLSWDVSYRNKAGIIPVKLSEYNVWPNPSANKWTIMLPEQIQMGAVLLYDAKGRLIQVEMHCSSDKLEINAFGLAEGMYTLMIPAYNGVKIIKLNKL